MAEVIFKVARTSRFWERAMHVGRMPPRASAATTTAPSVSPRIHSLAGCLPTGPGRLRERCYVIARSQGLAH
jgi:hypothetical protein